GARLRATVENVVSEVDLQIAHSEPDPATILTIVGSLPTAAKHFAPGGTFAAVAAGPAKSISIGVSEATRPLAALPKEIEDLDTMVASMQFALDVISQRVKAAPALATCQVQGVQGRIDISPEEPVEIKVGETKQFVVRSTAGIPSIEWVGSVSPRIELVKMLAGETMVVQITYREAVEGLSQVTFQAATRELKKQVTVNLLPGASSVKSEEPKGGGTKNGDPVAKKDEMNSGSAAATSGAINLPGPRNAFEKGLTGEKLQALQARLKVPQTGTFDVATRSAIQRWQVEKKKPLRNGVLQGTTFKEIMG
ncbi:MAG: peptidoglycan-binding domain-containing protein, partial [Prosthecobacter sp.]|nr:peptidoglycan-binding domain-containing protein [Prosthecobacter sp.]